MTADFIIDLLLDVVIPLLWEFSKDEPNGK